MLLKTVPAALLASAFVLSGFAQSTGPEKAVTPSEPAAGAKPAKPVKAGKAKEKTRKPERVRKEYSRPKPRGA